MKRDTPADTRDPGRAPGTPSSRRWLHFGLSAQLLVLTVLFVMFAQVCIYVPSIANYRIGWINERLSAAHTAALVFEAAPDVPDSLANQILDSIGARALAMKIGHQRRLLATSELPGEVVQDVDVRDVAPVHAIVEAFRTLLFANDNDLLRADRTGTDGRRIR